MALIRICDRCESDSSKVETIVIRFKTLADREVDLCPTCIEKLSCFFTGDDETENEEEETSPEESKKEQDETIAMCDTCNLSPNDCTCERLRSPIHRGSK